MHDVIVVGGGIAGLRAAVAASHAGASVALITQSHPTRSHSVVVQDGINSAQSPNDRWEDHAAETLEYGEGLSPADVVNGYCREAADLVLQLDRFGVPFNRQGTVIDRQLLPGSTKARASYVNDSSGLAITQTLYEQAIGAKLDFYNEWIVTSLVRDEGRCCGVVALEFATGRLSVLSAGAVVLATGGPRRAFRTSTASLQCSGAGIATAYREGVELIDMEFVQYDPAVLKDRRLALSPLLLTRCVSQKDGSLKLDGTLEGPEADRRFPDTVHRVKALAGLDLLSDSIPVEPAMSRLLGGIAVDVDGATSVPGLFAAGECAGTGFHGARGLDGNFLLASIASGNRAGLSAAKLAGSTAVSGDATLTEQNEAISGALSRPGGAPVAALREELANLMHMNVGQARDASGLASARDRVASMKQEYANLGAGSDVRDYNFGLVQYLELGWLLDVAEAIIASANERTESRGVHQRTDYPATDDGQRSRLTVMQVDNAPSVNRQPLAS